MPPNDHPALSDPKRLAELVERFGGNFSRIARHLTRGARRVSRDSVRRALELAGLKDRADALALSAATPGKRRQQTPVEKIALIRATKGRSREEAAELLGVSVPTLQRRLRQYDLQGRRPTSDRGRA